MFEAKEILSQNNDWVTFVLLGVVVVLVFIKVLFNERLWQTAILFFSKKYIVIYLNKEKNTSISLYQFLFFIVQLLVLSLMFYFGYTTFFENKTNANVHIFVLVMCVVALYFTLRYLLGLFVAFLFDLNRIHNKILYYKISYFNNIALWLLPVLVLYVYTTNYNIHFLKFTFFVFLLLLLIRYILVLKNNKKLIINNLFYFILYICALEIAPLLIFFKLTI